MMYDISVKNVVIQMQYKILIIRISFNHCKEIPIDYCKLIAIALCSFSLKIRAKKRFLAKLGLEPGTKRVSTGGCLNHSATQQVIAI